jgi:AP-1 complex subunit gamma-1
VDCLKDPDVSIRQRALELIYHLVNHENVENLTAELLNYLVLCPREHRADICTRVLRVVDRFSPEDRWRVDTLITMLTIAGRETTRDVQSATIVYISRASEDLQAYATHKLLKALRDDDGSQRGLLNVGIWCIGEYGDLVLNPYTYNPPSSSGNASEVSDIADGTSPVTISFMGLEPDAVVLTVEGVMNRHSCPMEVKERCLTSFAKLSDRFKNTGDEATLNRLQGLVQKSKTSHSLEMQLRSCEYDALLNAVKGIVPPKSGEEDIFGVTDGGINPAVISAAKEALARMPVVDLKVLQKKKANAEFYDMSDPSASPSKPAPAAKKGGGDLLDLEDIFAAPATTAPAAVQQNGTSPVKTDVDLLSDIFSAAPVAAPAAPSGGFDPFSGMMAPAAPAAPVNPMDLFGAPPAPVAAAPMGGMDIFGAPPVQQQASPMGGMSAPMAAAPAAPAGAIAVPGFSHQGLSVEFSCTKPDTWNKQKSTLIATFKNSTDAPIYGLNMQCAVPKYVTMDMQPPTSTTVPQSGGNAKAITQTINVTNSMLGTKNLMLKLKIGFTSKGTKIDHMATCSGFPAGQY